jgi:hypothetical protein
LQNVVGYVGSCSDTILKNEEPQVLMFQILFSLFNLPTQVHEAGPVAFEDVLASHFVSGVEHCQSFIFENIFLAGLPDFSRYNIGTQTGKCTK